MLIRHGLPEVHAPHRSHRPAVHRYASVPRVRVLLDYRPALRDRSGVGESTDQLARALVAAFPRAGAGRELDLTLFSSSWKDRLSLPSELAATARAVDRRIPVRLLNFAWQRLGWPPAEALAGAAFDVVHSPHPLLLPARHAAQVITIHDLHFLSHPEHTAGEIRRDYAALVRAHAHRADRVLTPSRFTAGEIERRLGVAADRIAVCPHGAPDWPARPASPRDGYILFVGTLEPRKNIGGLLDAYEMLLRPAEAGRYEPEAGRDVRGVPELVLAGKATDAARPWLDRISRAPLVGHVRAAGYIDPAARYDLYAGARLLVLPSFEEGFGLPALEAMASGVPVVGSKAASIAEVVGNAGMLVEPKNARQMAGSLIATCTDDELHERLRTRALIRAAQFTWQRTAAETYEVFRKVHEQRRIEN
jgi:glycosyltransferase involved in cell wall biosynthesis